VKQMHRLFLKLFRQQEGSSIVETAFLMPVLLLICAGAVDFGRAYFLAIEVSSAAQAGAVYGSQAIGDTAGMISAAKLDAPDVSGLVVTPSYGCECYDGSSISANCAAAPAACSGNNYVNFAHVMTSASYTPIFPYPGIPSSILLTGNAYLRTGGD
jgi:TadE-like protein